MMHLRRHWAGWSVVWCGRNTFEAMITNHPQWTTCPRCLVLWGREPSN